MQLLLGMILGVSGFVFWMNRKGMKLVDRASFDEFDATRRSTEHTTL